MLMDIVFSWTEETFELGCNIVTSASALVKYMQPSLHTWRFCAQQKHNLVQGLALCVYDTCTHGWGVYKHHRQQRHSLFSFVATLCMDKANIHSLQTCHSLNMCVCMAPVHIDEAPKSIWRLSNLPLFVCLHLCDPCMHGCGTCKYW